MDTVYHTLLNQDLEMKAKKEYYKNYVDGKVRLKKGVFFLIFLITFCIVLYDSFINNLPFHYIAFFIIGRLLSMLLSKTQKVKWVETENKFIVERSIAGLLIMLAVILFRVFLFPRILTEFNVIYISDALLLIVMGWFLGRVKLISAKIEEKAFSGFVENQSPG